MQLQHSVMTPQVMVSAFVLGGHQLLHFYRLPMLVVVSASYMRNRCSPSSALSQSAEPEGCVVPNTFVPSSCSFRCEHGHAAPARCSSRA